MDSPDVLDSRNHKNLNSQDDKYSTFEAGTYSTTATPHTEVEPTIYNPDGYLDMNKTLSSIIASQIKHGGMSYLGSHDNFKHAQSFGLHTGENVGVGSSLINSNDLTRLPVIDKIEYPHQCNVCGSMFTRASSLSNHKKRHNSQLPSPSKTSSFGMSELGSNSVPFNCQIAETSKNSGDNSVSQSESKTLNSNHEIENHEILTKKQGVESNSEIDSSIQKTCENIQPTEPVSHSDNDDQLKSSDDIVDKTFDVDQFCASLLNSSDNEQHAGVDTGEKGVTCNICGIRFDHPFFLIQHMNLHARETQSEYFCDTEQSGEVPDYKPYECAQCGATFKGLSNLKQHMTVHTGERPYNCNLCDATFIRQGHLKRHMKSHLGDKSYCCTQCKATFTQSSHLKQHMRTHTGETPYKCEECDAEFKKAYNLQRHMGIHTGRKVHECSECTATFRELRHLKQHMVTHTGEKPYKCDECDVTFARSAHLKRHKTIHSGEKPYKCELCDDAFNQSQILKRHMLTHTRT